MIPLSVPSIKGNEWKYIKECLDTEWVSSAGRFVQIFEEEICKYTGSKYAIACNSGTSALQASLRICEIKPEDEVIVPTVTFIATVNSVKYFNAIPVFMDCDEYYNIDVYKTIEFINDETYFENGVTYNKKTKRRILAIIPVHVFGNAVKLDNIINLCKERNIKIIEDATESLGTYYTKGNLEGQFTGVVGDIGCYSFNGNKIITTGGGGMIVTNNSQYARKAKYLTNQAKDDIVRAVHNDIGYNFRMTNIQAALGVAQLERISNYLSIKKKNYELYRDLINSIYGLTIADVPDYANSNYWFYSLQINKVRYKKDREQIMQYLGTKNIETRPLWYLNHRQKPYINCQNYRIENAYKLWEKTLNIPCSVNLKKDEIYEIVDHLRNFSGNGEYIQVIESYNEDILQEKLI